jgi:hypothetical protein
MAKQGNDTLVARRFANDRIKMLPQRMSKCFGFLLQ